MAANFNIMNPSDKDILNTLSHVIKDEIILFEIKKGEWRASRNGVCHYDITKWRAKQGLFKKEKMSLK